MFKMGAEVDPKIVGELEKILREKYSFSGSLSDIAFGVSTNESFRQLISALEKQVPSQKAETNESDDGDETPKVGDRALVHWYGNGWFTATIESWVPDTLSYMIRWTDGNWAAEAARYDNLCVDKVPSSSSVGVGTKVLFKQGLYYCGKNSDGSICDSTGRTLSDAKKSELAKLGKISDRWHMGRITSITKDANGEPRYNGKHVDFTDPQVSRNNYVGYSLTFTDLRIDQLRVIPNIFNCLDSDTKGDKNKDASCDVFISKVAKDDETVIRITKKFSGKYKIRQSTHGQLATDIQSAVQLIKNSSIYLVCLSDNFIEDSQAMSELLYAKKTLGKTVIPVVLGKSDNWLQTTAGMLLAGQLYIQFASSDVWQEKAEELEANLKKLVFNESKNASTDKKSQGEEIPPRVFLSYCWTNSKSSFDAGQVRSFSGHEFSDPRKIKQDLEKVLGEKVWLDIEQLNSVDDSGMFGQIADGLKQSSIVVMCVSKEYTNSQNCKMEANFALRSLKKSALVLEVGRGTVEDRDAWKGSSVGMVLPTDHQPYVMTLDTTNSTNSYDTIIQKISQHLKETVLTEPPSYDASSDLDQTYDGSESSLRASIPMVGDAVIAHYAAWQFYPAVVANFDKSSMKYTVDWDDPDPSCRTQPYDLVAMNTTPTEDLIGIGSRVLFKQGRYQFGASTGDVWNLGEITRTYDEGGQRFYDGKHAKTAQDGLAVASWPSYRPTFERSRCQDLRLFPNAIEMLQAYKNL
ncbi:uncharacterized protein LOC121423874 [Lytechinus variegatus]|uniref:uncharacterized protein LOC121423874 n=1 Tax=Lytechinus variegatus TaxID=7654 RepID=UPI001BB188CB|nr:uncharacterized protein LOC121423874 [Lytechinus variegatus]